MTTAQILSITIKPEQQKPDEHFLRVPVEEAQLVTGYGIEGDRKGGHPKRQINIMSAETLDNLRAEGYNIAPGEMGEQMVVQGVSIDTLPNGIRLQLGENAVIEIVEPREGCVRFEQIQGRPRSQSAGRIGMMARVVRDGLVRVGDAVRVMQQEI